MHQLSHHRVVLITGAARRIGAELASYLHAAQFNIVIHYHQSKQAAEQLTATLNAQRQHSAIALAMNLEHISALPELIQQAVNTWGRLDVLINNASSFYPTPLDATTPGDWQRLMSPNLTAPYFLVQAAHHALALHKGCVINITDAHLNHPRPDYSIYQIAKAGLDMLTKTLAKDLAPTVRVNAIAPGSILWPDVCIEPANQLSAASQQARLATIALGRQGCPADLAHAALFLIDHADYMTGQILAVDGGQRG